MGKKSKKKIKPSGQAIVEYILLLMMVVGMLLAFLSKFTDTFDLSSVNMGAKLEKQMRTGAAPPTLWKK